jgi:hypothetical protein
VQLHVIEELLAMLPMSDSDGEQAQGENEVYEDAMADTQEVFMSISTQAVNGLEHTNSMRLQGVIQGREVIILIDSGSSDNFISSRLAKQLCGVQALQKPVRLKVAGGGVLQGDKELPQCEWRCQGNTFVTDVKVLPLQCYDMILGMKWLELLGLVSTQ